MYSAKSVYICNIELGNPTAISTQLAHHAAHTRNIPSHFVAPTDSTPQWTFSVRVPRIFDSMIIIKLKTYPRDINA